MILKSECTRNPDSMHFSFVIDSVFTTHQNSIEAFKSKLNDILQGQIKDLEILRTDDRSKISFSINKAFTSDVFITLTRKIESFIIQYK